MIQQLDLHDNNVFAYRIDGEVTADELKPLTTILDEKTKQHDKLRIYAEYVGIDNISLKALWEDIKFDISHLTDFEKAAIVTDKEWIGISAGLANLIPGLDVKFFKFSEQEQAQQWIKN